MGKQHSFHRWVAPGSREPPLYWNDKEGDPMTVVGTWRVMSCSLLTLGTNEVSRPFGNNPIGYLQYSPGGHMVAFVQTGNPKRSTLPFSDADRAELHKGISAYTGTYSVDGNKVTHHVVASWRPDWIGNDEVRYVELNGKNLTIKTPPETDTTGKQVVATLTFERVE
jgi:hypothetical protein